MFVLTVEQWKCVNMYAWAIGILTLGAWVDAMLQLSECEVHAKIDSGHVCGRVRKDTAGRDYASFRGIPYAKPPLGKLRFQELQPLEPFSGVFDAREEGPICYQDVEVYKPLFGTPPMSENCITINVHVPADVFMRLQNNESFTPLPIFMYNYGGSFEHGSGNPIVYGPEYLMTKDVMLVTYNHRINVPGFISLPESGIPGNNGLRDALAALRWLQRNAKVFGGNPEEVTFGGQSSGGAMVNLLSISPAVRGQGLFKRAISISGNSMTNFFTYSPVSAKRTATGLLKILNIDPSEDPQMIYDKLVEMPIQNLTKAFIELKTKLVGIIATPVVEIPHENFTTMLPKTPEELVNEGAGNEIPVMLAFASNECEFQQGQVTDESIRSLPKEAVIPGNLLNYANPEIVPMLATKILDKYYNGTLETATFEEYSPYCQDSQYWYGLMRLTKKRLALKAEPTYIYEFDYHGEHSIIKQLVKNDFKGACHMEGITYFFRFNHFLGPMTTNELEQPDPDSRMKQWMTTIFTNFVKTGAPGPATFWPPTDERLQFQHITEPMTIDYRPADPKLRSGVAFFDMLYSYVYPSK